MLKDKNNKRRHKRFNVDLLDIRTNTVYANDIVIRDISITGASLLTSLQLAEGREYSIRIMDNEMDFEVAGTVIWSGNRQDCTSKEDEHLKFSAGLRFNRLEQNNVKELTKFIEQHLIERHTLVKVHDMSGCRCNVRYRVDRRETAILNSEETYKVKTLSLGGALLESAHPLDPETRLNMELTMPDGKVIGFVGRVVSCISAEEGNNHEIGIEFIKMCEDDTAMLKDFIREMYLKEAGF